MRGLLLTGYGFLLCFLAAASSPAIAQQRQEETLNAKLGEQIVWVPSGRFELQTTIFKPPGEGPFPLIVMNHGKAAGNAYFQNRARFATFSAHMVARGYVVILPNRQGVSKSGGAYTSAGCFMRATGDAQAEDIRATLDYATKLPYVDAGRIVVAGQSHGGMSTIAFGAGAAYPGVQGLINFAGGNKSEGCNSWERNMVSGFGDWGKTNRYRTLWFYGENESYFPPSVYRPAHAAYVAAGGTAQLVEFGVFPHGDAHGMVGHAKGVSTWWPQTERFLTALGLPTAVVNPQAAPMVAPPATTFAALRDIEAVPHLKATGRDGYKLFLEKTEPRAFALSASGAWGWSNGGDDPLARAVEGCQRRSKEPCRLYAVDQQVVWNASEEKQK